MRASPDRPHALIVGAAARPACGTTRLAAGYARRRQDAHVLRAQLQAWRVWRAYTERRRRLAALSGRAQLWHTRRWLLGRAWGRCKCMMACCSLHRHAPAPARGSGSVHVACRWLVETRLHYRQLVAARAERERLECLATHAGEHEQQVAALRCGSAACASGCMPQSKHAHCSACQRRAPLLLRMQGGDCGAAGPPG